MNNTNILSVIRSDTTLAEKVGMVCDIDVYPELQPPYARVTSSIPVTAFAKDSGGGEYVLLADGSAGYLGADGQCGRIAEDLRGVFLLTINCASAWENYARKKYVDAPKLLAQDTVKYEIKGREEFSDAWGDEFPNYDTLRDEVAKALNLTISSDISKDILPAFFKTATREPLYFFTEDDGRRSDDLMR